MQVKYNTLVRQEDGTYKGEVITLDIQPISFDFSTGLVRGEVTTAGQYKGKLIEAQMNFQLPQ
ncbi:TPA: hypothetical protein ACX6Q6_003559 [Photobacterium damselae]